MGLCQVGDYCVEGAVVRAGEGALRCVVAVGDYCVEGRVSGAVISGATARRGYKGRT